MSMRAERLSSSTPTTKPPLHNFDVPWLKWGSQKHLRCIKPSDSSDRHRKVRSLPSTAVSELRNPKKQKRDDGHIEEIRAVGEKVICDLKAEADKIKDEILSKEGLMIFEERKKMKIVRNNEEIGDRDDQSSPPNPSLSTGIGGGGGGESGAEAMKPWNLRTRKASKPLMKVTGNENSVKVINGHQSHPVREKEKEKEKERAKFSVSLMKKEIEEDFMAMVNHRPARRPKKRPRAVQKELDYLFPGLFLTEVTPDIYDR